MPTVTQPLFDGTALTVNEDTTEDFNRQVMIQVSEEVHIRGRTMARRSLLCPRSIRPSRRAGGCHGDCPLSFVWNTSQGFNACVHMHVAAGNQSERTLLPFFFVRLPLCFGWVFLGVVGGGCVGVGVCAGCAPCAASLLVLSVRILGLASNSDLDIVSHFKLQSFLSDLSRFLHYDVADGRKTTAVVGVVSPLGNPVCCEFLLLQSGLHVLQSCLSTVHEGR